MTLNRPDKMNALNPEMIVRLARAWDAIEADTSVRVAILTGAGERTFCAGADLGRLTPLLTRARAAEDEWDEALLADPKILNRAMLRRLDFTTPVIAAMRGTVVAGGMELALACDLRIVAEDSTLGLAEVKRGLIPAAGGIARVSRQIPWAAAAEILLIGERISAAEALRIGLVNRVVPGRCRARNREKPGRGDEQKLPARHAQGERGDARRLRGDTRRGVWRRGSLRQGGAAFGRCTRGVAGFHAEADATIYRAVKAKKEALLRRPSSRTFCLEEQLEWI